MKTGAELIRIERLRQITKEGYSPEHDDQHTDGSLAINAALCACDGTDSSVVDNGIGRPNWDITGRHGYNGQKPNRIRLLAIAGALIAAEIDRLQRIKK